MPKYRLIACGQEEAWSHKLMKLLAPVEGTVQQLAVHTVGGVITPAQVLMVIVPPDYPFEVEAFVENKDIGFVNAGQEAEIKIETFPYTKHGTIHGEVKHVSSDAIDDDKRGLVYSSRVKMERATIQVENKFVNLGSWHGGDCRDQDRQTASD